MSDDVFDPTAYAVRVDHMVRPATANHLDRCVSGTFTRTADRDAGTGYVREFEFMADGIAFRGRWIVFLNPVFTDTLRAVGVSGWSSTHVREYRGFHRVPAHAFARITYDLCEVAA